MHEQLRAAFVGHDETVPLSDVEPLDKTGKFYKTDGSVLARRLTEVTPDLVHGVISAAQSCGPQKAIGNTLDGQRRLRFTPRLRRISRIRRSESPNQHSIRRRASHRFFASNCG